MSELTVEDVRALLRRQPDPEGRLAHARARRGRRAARSIGEREDDASARGRGTRAAAHRHDQGRRQGRVRRRSSSATFPPRAAISGSCSSRTHCGRTRPSPTTSLTASSCARWRRRRSQRACALRSTSSRSDISASASRTSCRGASSSASRSRARSSTTRRSSCSTSRCRISMRSCARKRAPGCAS